MGLAAFLSPKKGSFEGGGGSGGHHRRWVGEELGRAVSLLLDDHVITKIAGTGEEKGKEKQAPGQDRAG